MATATTTDRIIHTCVLCGNRWNPRYVSFPGCPYCQGTGEVKLHISVREGDRQKKTRKAQLRKRIEATSSRT